MLSATIVLSGLLLIEGIAGEIPSTAIPDTIKVEYSGQADLTGDTIPELVHVSAIGMAWDALEVRLEIRSYTNNLLYADEWSSKDWCGGRAFYDLPRDSIETWIRGELEMLVDPEHFLTTGTYGSRNGSLMNNRREVGYGIRADQYEVLWREKYNIPIHEHLTQQIKQREIRAEFRDQISEEQIAKLLDEVVGSTGYIYDPHWDGTFIVAWIPSENRFAIVIYPG